MSIDVFKAFKAATTEPVEPEFVPLTSQEKDFFVENAAEINFLIREIFANPDDGGLVARYGMYMFHKGREFEDKYGLI